MKGNPKSGAKHTVNAVAYLRTSSATNAGADRDSDKRQRDAIASFAGRASYVIVDEFYDVAVSGADPIETRPGFAALLDRIESNGVRVVLIEDASRFARDLVTQELGVLALIGRGVRVLTASGDDLTITDDPFKVAMRQIAGAFAQLEKARLVHKLRMARERKRAAGHKVEGRKSFAEQRPEVAALVHQLARKPRGKPARSLRAIATELEARGILGETGKRLSAETIRSILSRRLIKSG